MRLNLLIIDDFYVNPDQVRNFALTQDFSVKGNYPGARTKSFWSDDIKQAIEHYMQFAGKITDSFDESGYTGAFQIATANDRTWIHSDTNNMWAGVCYLTPDAPYTGGTGLFRHKATGEHTRITHDHEGYDYTKYDLFDRIGNKYNRLVIYRSDLFHASLDYFGDNLHNGRLFQTFFFDTERF
jgi:Family of unknown function (DUF6445)